MEDKLYKAFVDATRNVLNLMLNITDISDHPTENYNCDDEVSIAVGIVGDLQGEVVYRFPVRTSLNMVNIMSGMQINQVDAFVTSAISEIANIISGNVVSALSYGDTKCDILPPEPYMPDEEKQYQLKTSCYIGTAIGEICVEIGLNKAS